MTTAANVNSASFITNTTNSADENSLPVLRSQSPETQALLAQVIETKVTRAELVDMVVDRLRDELQTERKNLEKQLSEIPQEALTLEQAFKLLRVGGAACYISAGEDSPYKDGKSKRVFRVEVGVDLPTDTVLPKSFTAIVAKRAAVEKQLTQVQLKIRKLESGRVKARSELVKQALEQTPEGARILRAIDDLKLSVKNRLLSTQEKSLG